MSKKAQKNGRNHKKTGKKRAILPKRPFKTGDLVTLLNYGQFLPNARICEPTGDLGTLEAAL